MLHPEVSRVVIRRIPSVQWACIESSDISGTSTLRTYYFPSLVGRFYAGSA